MNNEVIAKRNDTIPWTPVRTRPCFPVPTRGPDRKIDRLPAASQISIDLSIVQLQRHVYDRRFYACHGMPCMRLPFERQGLAAADLPNTPMPIHARLACRFDALPRRTASARMLKATAASGTWVALHMNHTITRQATKIMMITTISDMRQRSRPWIS